MFFSKFFKSLFLSVLFVCLFFNYCAAQQDTLIFQWQNSNLFPVTFDVFEVEAPPFTSVVISQINFSPIPDHCPICVWKTAFTFDDSLHYFRVRSVRYDSIFSPFSKPAFVRPFRIPESPTRVIIIPSYP